MRRSTRSYAVFFGLIATLRLFSLFPFIIDDDEAWWSASAHSLGRVPWEIYRRAVDDKPPGITWFYWICERILPDGGDPRLARAAYCLLTIAASGLLGWMASRLLARKTQEERSRSA